MSHYKNTIERKLGAIISPRVFGVWILFSITSIVLVPGNDRGEWTGPLTAAVSVVNRTAGVFALGVPFVLGAAFLFTSETAKNELSSRANDWRSFIVNFSYRFVFLLVVSGLLVLFAAVYHLMFVAVGSGISYTLIMGYFPGLYSAALIMTVLECLVTVFVVVLISDKRLGSLLGVFLFFEIGWIIGVLPTNSLRLAGGALFSPYHMYRFLSYALVGNVSDPILGELWGNPETMSSVVGTYVTWTDLIYPLASWTVIGLLLLPFSIKMLEYDAENWEMEIGGKTVPWEDPVGSEQTSKLSTVSQRLSKWKIFVTRRRQVFVVFLIVFWLSVPHISNALRQTSIEENTTVLYETDPQGIIIDVGEIVYGEVQIEEAPVGNVNYLYIQTQILDWYETPEPLTWEHAALHMNIEEFEGQGYESNGSFFRTMTSSITTDNSLQNFGSRLFGESGTFVWTFRYNTTSPGAYQLRVEITISVRVERL